MPKFFMIFRSFDRVPADLQLQFPPDSHAGLYDHDFLNTG